jgi:hypothetical protein
MKAWHIALVLTFSACGCPKGGSKGNASPNSTRDAQRYDVAQAIFESGLKNQWQETGTATREIAEGKPARIKFGSGGTWTLSHPADGRQYGALVFRLKMPAGEAEFLEVRVDSKQSTVFPRVKVAADHRADVGDGWGEILIPLSQLNPNNQSYDRIVFRGFRDVSDFVLMDKIALTTRQGDSPELAKSEDGGGGGKPVSLSIDCRAVAKKISPNIYGIALHVVNDDKDTHNWKLGATIRRWGGNTMSRYNWENGFWNTGHDWFYENVSANTHDKFLKANQEHGIKSTLTVPMLGWVAKDSTSMGFPVSAYGGQDKNDAEFRAEAGNGEKGGKPLTPGPPSRTSVAAPPEFVKRWIEALRKGGGARVIDQYILDNEPALWNSTHRDVHPDAVTYDELLDRTIRYGSAVRAADPEAEIAGPAEWGWPAYFYSAKDSAVGLPIRPDRRLHGDVPIIAWYLQKLREHEQKSGTKILDVLDFHFYPQAEGVGLGTEGKTDPGTAALRIRSTRALWDPSYVDESWIKEAVMLIPRMKELVEKNYPGRKISIGEWNFGAETHMSGGLATAEALGRFGQGGVHSAYYWTYPPADSPAMNAFLAYRNYDGKGAHFLEYSIGGSAPQGTSIFASRDDAGKHLVAIVLNQSPDTAIQARLELNGCHSASSADVYTYAGVAFRKQAGHASDTNVTESFPPYSINVIDLHFNAPMPGTLEK